MEKTEKQKSDPAIIFSNLFTEKQIEAIKLIIRNGFWGDCDMNFGAGKETSYAYGYYTNTSGKGKEFSGTLSGISKTIKTTGTNAVTMRPDWWGDGSGDMMFFNLELMDKEELQKWANQ